MTARSNGAGSSTAAAKKGKKKAKAKKISLVNVEKDPKYLTLLDENQ